MTATEGRFHVKACSKCGANPRASGQGYCYGCRNAYMRAHRAKYAELPESQRRRAVCRAYTRVLIQRGKIERGPCEVCRTRKNVQAHHTDYRNPRLVHWVCKSCHRDVHEDLARFGKRSRIPRHTRKWWEAA